MSKATPGPDLPPTLAEILRRIASELHRLAGMSGELQIAVSPLVAHRPAMHTDHAIGLQSLDLLEQTLADLARFVEALAAEEHPPHYPPMATATRALRLSALATRLARPEGSPEHPSACGSDDTCHDDSDCEIWT